MTDANGSSTDVLTKPVSRRGALALLGGLGLLAAGCSSGSDGSSATASTSGSSATSTTTGATTTTGAAAATVTSCSTIPDETAGPYPGDGSNGPNALTESGIVRKDMSVMVAAPGMLSQSLLGMNFIGSLSGFDVRGDRMILRD